jgi:hypothetical protein
VRGLQDEIVEGIREPSKEHRALLDALRTRLAQDPGVYIGTTDIIAGPCSRHRPDAIYYRYGSIYATSPIIYEVLTCDGVLGEDIIDRCRLFADTARNRLGQFYIVMPEKHSDGKAEQIVVRMLDNNEIKASGIITMGTAETCI